MTTMASTVFQQILIMFCLIIIGVICYKVRLIDNRTNKSLSDLVLMLVNPMLIFTSYQREYEAKLLKGLLISLILALFTHLFSIIITSLLVRNKKSKEDLSIERFSVIYSNCGFIGIPLVNGIFGSEGVFYMTAYMTIFNLFIWTHGAITMSGKKDVKMMLKSLVSPSVIAIFLGFGFFMARITVPEVLLVSLNYVSSMNTPLAMIVAGVIIAQTDIIKLFTTLRNYYIAFLKLLMLPLAVFMIYQFFDIPDVVLLTSVLAAACPIAATVNLFALRYQKNSIYASELFALTTILSLGTIPFVMTLSSYLLKM